MLSYEERPQTSRRGNVPTSRIAMRPSMIDSNTKASAAPSQAKAQRHMWIITGPAGCGKSTVAQYLAKHMEIPYIEGDEFHTASSIEKMAKGVPLTDADRWDWLVLLRQNAMEKLTSAGSTGVVLTCSALKRKYRDVIRVAAYFDHNVEVHFVYLRASEEVLLQRVKARQGHFMKDTMVHSQFKSLEEPKEDEMDCLFVDVNDRSLQAVQRDALRTVQEVLAAGTP